MKKIYVSIILLILIWLLIFYSSGNIVWTSISWAISSAFYLGFPMAYVLSKKTRDEKTIKKLALWNSVIVAGLTFIYSYDSNAADLATSAVLFELLGAILIGITYYFINYCLYSEDKKKNSIRKKNKEHYTSVCSNCGTRVKDSDQKCPKCGELFESNETDAKENNKSKSDMTQKYSDLNKLKELLDNKVITKEEFEKEKKKVLND